MKKYKRDMRRPDFLILLKSYDVGEMIHQLTFFHSPTIPKASGQHSSCWKSILGSITTSGWTIIPNLSLKLDTFFYNDLH